MITMNVPMEVHRSDLVIVSNRLPVSRVRREKRTVWESSPGGLVSALRPILHDRDCAWVGWAGVSNEQTTPFQFDGIHQVPVPLNSMDVKAFYEGFSNRALWPLYHDAVRKPEYQREWWKRYVEVNQRYAEAAAASAKPEATAWVHDYHLQLVPTMLRRLRPDVRIGFFMHIPFPPQELFGQLPWRREILQGIMGSDVIGFQTRVGVANFIQVCHRYGDATGLGNTLRLDGREISVAAFPISIDFAHYEGLAKTAEVRKQREELQKRIGPGRRVLLGVDRLDYTKGIDIRLQAFRELLASGKAAPDSCVLVQVAVPSREHVDEYRDLRVKVERLVGEINGEYGDIGRTPVQYLHRSVDQIELSALYSLADVMLVTPLRDGMNLVCKEYVASRIDNTGALVLSEFTGAAKELPTALQVNPHDIDGVVNAMDQALRMTPAEQASRMTVMRRFIKRHNVHEWAAEFFAALEHAHVG